ncbi:MAG: hypothetical protein SA378_08850 [Sedimentibacter sp.]|uniref:hypothetical protein n=1 Tax=Sedimentibacter sp. TaxID=1960295 RepID=UPI002981FDE9|nr:hypothetical protein [Sedimentibacter sp.]MDW5300230.1 hypothetical protein [Sedimentibacter sp.]
MNESDKKFKNVITPDYIKNLKLDDNKKYKILMINKNFSNTGVDTLEPARELLKGRLISQHGYIFVFECINKRNVQKRVCINKIDFIINNKLITACK